MINELTTEHWEPIRAAINDYTMHVVDASLHRSASKADIAQASALSALQKVRRAIEAATPETFQARVAPWMLECFGAEVSRDRTGRSHRFLEESLELVQAAGCSASEAHQLVDYVFGRPVGELAQEVGGVMVTLAALCLAQDVDMHAAGETELARVWTKIDVIRAKHAAKPKHSPLPGAAAPSSALGLDEVAERAAFVAEANRRGWRHGDFMLGAYAGWLAGRRGSPIPVADWNNRRTDSLDGWINELLTLREHRELRGIPAFARDAMKTIAHGLADHRPAGYVHDSTERDMICKRIRRVARAAGVENAMPEDDLLYACVGTMLGTIASAMERAAGAREPLPLMHQAFRTTETMGNPERIYRMIFDFPSLAALHAADAEWIALDRIDDGGVAERAPAEAIRLLAPQPAPPRDVVPGKVHCAKCGFTLQRVNLYMLSGMTGAGGEETEPCPNDGTPLLPVTWEQEAREAMCMAEQQFDRAHALEAAGVELVACKDLKDEESRLRQRRDVAISRDREATAVVDAMRDDYNRRKPLAWAAMRALLPKVASHG